MNKYSLRLERCEECDDHPIVIAGYVNEERFYGRDFRQDEGEDLNEIMEEVFDIVQDMYEHEVSQNQ